MNTLKLKNQWFAFTKNRAANATNGSIPRFLVLPGSESTITEITEYIYLSLLESFRNLPYEIKRGCVPAHQHCDLFYPLDRGSALVCRKLGNVLVP